MRMDGPVHGWSGRRVSASLDLADSSTRLPITEGAFFSGDALVRLPFLAHHREIRNRKTPG